MTFTVCATTGRSASLLTSLWNVLHLYHQARHRYKGLVATKMGSIPILPASDALLDASTTSAPHLLPCQTRPPCPLFLDSASTSAVPNTYSPHQPSLPRPQLCPSMFAAPTVLGPVQAAVVAKITSNSYSCDHTHHLKLCIKPFQHRVGMP